MSAKAKGTILKGKLLRTSLYALLVQTSHLSVARASCVQWGGNGHCYEAVLVGEVGITWSDAQAASIARGGYLTTITSAEENSFVFSLVSGDSRFWTLRLGDGIGPWLGGLQPAGSQEPSGGWEWLTGEAFNYTNWSPGEPNNHGGGPEDRLQFFGQGSLIGSAWNDFPGGIAVTGYIVETSPIGVQASQWSDVKRIFR